MRLAMAMLVVPFLSSSATAAVLHVPADYPTIGAATAVAVSGDEVLVAPGTYNERFTLGPGQDGVKIHSESGPAVTIIDGGLTGSVVAMTLVGSGTELIGFTIQHGGHSLVTPADLGGGIRLDRSSPLIENDVIKLNLSYRGAIYVSKGSPSITSCDVDSNASTEGGGIFVESGSPNITGNTLTANQAPSGRGGGVAIASGSSAFNGNTVANNVGDQGAGIYAASGTVSGNTIANNHANNGGGGVFAEGSAMIQNNVIQGNRGYWGGVGVWGGSPTISGNTITGNIGTFGGGIQINSWSASPFIQGNLLQNNNGQERGGGICVFAVAGGVIEGNQILTNFSLICGGVYVGAVPSPPAIKNNLIQGNKASSGPGGGLMADGSTNLILENNQFLGNSASTVAGGIYETAAANVTIRGNLIQDNECPHGSGGGIYVDQGASGTLEKNQILRNHCVSWGGGVTIWTNSHSVLTGNTIALNRGDLGGGNVYLKSGSTAQLSNNILSHSPNVGLQLEVGGAVSVTMSCNDVSNNVFGNYLGLADPTGTNGNISLDPLYCDLATLDVHLSSVSPCTAANAPAGCGLIGALDVGCEGPVRTEVMTWGSIKASYR